MNICRNISRGVFPFVENVCLYMHSETVNKIGEVSNTFKCNKCDEGFTNKTEVIYHSKQNHSVPESKNNNQGCCWFMHIKMNESENFTYDF